MRQWFDGAGALKGTGAHGPQYGRACGHLRGWLGWLKRTWTFEQLHILCWFHRADGKASLQMGHSVEPIVKWFYAHFATAPWNRCFCPMDEHGNGGAFLMVRFISLASKTTFGLQVGPRFAILCSIFALDVAKFQASREFGCLQLPSALFLGRCTAVQL